MRATTPSQSHPDHPSARPDPACNISGDLISTMRSLATAGIPAPARPLSDTVLATTFLPHHDARITSGGRRAHDVGRDDPVLGRPAETASPAARPSPPAIFDQFRKPSRCR